MHKRIVFRNKLRLITVPLLSVKSVTVLILVGAGSRYETKKTNGLAHFAEHMFFKGTKKRPTPLDVSVTIDSIGGESNAFTSKEITGFYVKAASKHLDLALDVLVDMLLNSNFDSREIEKERGVIIEEINMHEDTPMRQISSVYESLLYGDTPLGWPVLGTKDTIRHTQRQDFISYLEGLYVPSNMVVTIAGDLPKNIQQVEDMVELQLGSLKDRKKIHASKAVEKQSGPEVRISPKKTQQAHLCIGVRTYPFRHKRMYQLAVLNALLGAGMSSRLFTKVREERGLAYYIRSNVEHYSDVGYLEAQAGIDTSKMEESITVILDEFRRLKVEKVGEQELRKAKEYLKGRITLELEDSQDVATMYAVPELLERRIKTPSDIMREIDAVTSAHVMEVAKEIFQSNKLNLAVIGPYEDPSWFKKLLTV
ncbi:MAG TPA: pitrilysin family protein [Patescibacteria group bacterium]|nr:pitrilysin family protein [Patescibacteria group bacterium]